MAADQASAAPGIFHLPITGRRGGRIKVVIGYTHVADDDFTRKFLMPYTWSITVAGYAHTTRSHEGVGAVQLHRLVYRHYHGPISAGLEIDHIDRDKLNNLPSNLRAVSKTLNRVNRGARRDNASGYKGVRRHCRGAAKAWQARIQVRGVCMCLGYFATAREAADAVNAAHQRYYPQVQVPNP